MASGRGHAGALRIHQRDAVLWVARLGRSDRIAVPEAPRVHLFAASGSAELEGGSTLTAGDAVRLIDAPALSVEASIDGTELLLWETG